MINGESSICKVVVWLTGIVMALTLGITGIRYLFQMKLHNRRVHTNTQIANANRFWKEVSGPGPYESDVIGRLAANLHPLLLEGAFGNSGNSKLLPHSLEGVILPRTFLGFYSKTHICPVGYHPTADVECEETGILDPLFVNRLRVAKTGQFGSLLMAPVRVPPYRFPFVPWLWLILFWSTALVAFVIGSVALWQSAEAGRYVDNQRTPTFRFKPVSPSNQSYIGSKITLMLMLPELAILWFLLILPAIKAKEALAVKKEATKLSRQQAERRKRLDEVGISDVYIRARANIKQLETLGAPTGKTAAKEYERIYAETSELVTELEQFPDQVSERAKLLIARQIKDENEQIRARPKDILSARDNLNAL